MSATGGYGLKIEVDAENCVGAGQCVLVAPEVFDQDDDGVVVVLPGTLTDPVGQKAAREAAVLCPSRALRLTREEPAL